MAHATGHERSPYGVMAEFDSAEALTVAAQRVRTAGYTALDAFSPFPVEGLYEMIGGRTTRLPRLVLGCGLLGGLTGFGLQTYLMVFDYPLNVGGRPLFSWPSFIPITFELSVLFAAIGGVLGLFIANKMPELYHPVFNVDRFERVTQDGFFLLVTHDDPKFDADGIARFFRTLEDPQPVDVAVVDY
jgi:hypothetical protein